MSLFDVVGRLLSGNAGSSNILFVMAVSSQVSHRALYVLTSSTKHLQLLYYMKYLQCADRTTVTSYGAGVTR